MNDYVIVKIIGKEVDVMCRVSGKYKKYMGLENGKRVLYPWLKKALYGCMQSAILWYNTFKNCLETISFKMNCYNPCVVNMETEGKQCTIC